MGLVFRGHTRVAKSTSRAPIRKELCRARVCVCVRTTFWFVGLFRKALGAGLSSDISGHASTSGWTCGSPPPPWQIGKGGHHWGRR